MSDTLLSVVIYQLNVVKSVPIFNNCSSYIDNQG